MHFGNGRTPRERALRHVAARSWGPALDPTLRVTLNFHPDRLVRGLPILDALAQDGTYRSQFVTGTSNGGLTAHPGGDRRRWESRIFGTAYDAAPAHERPVYGGLNFRRQLVGASPRFGSSHFRMTEKALGRATFCYHAWLPRPVDEVARTAKTAYDALDEVTVPRLVHFDLWRGNILVERPAGTAPRIGGLIDGERMFWGDPLADFVSLALLADIKQDKDFLTGYQEARRVRLLGPATPRPLSQLPLPDHARRDRAPRNRRRTTRLGARGGGPGTARRPRRTPLGPVRRIMSETRVLARPSAALSSVADSPRLGFARVGDPHGVVALLRLCSWTHQDPLTCADEAPRVPSDLIRRT
ncbi:DUF3626 domain-containing protein [Streptomyces sp. NBC_00996]|uniref:DUF3626 domain-containing protein n=1 Tax=Streptomyces sp. NBC_00996 TaxID=2903710 RepID=UPI00386CD9F6|nr:DUF3626 domain-containing protein [Streptomyces sp. NBC_00996]